jgi:Lon protease-like protein
VAIRLPLFPLSAVLVPGLVMPLHIFEPRYREMLAHCLATDREFGVVLIERGHEVGGGDVRCRIGTVAKILQADEVQDDHWAVIAAGTRRIRIRSWGVDKPWPCADVEDVPEEVRVAGGPPMRSEALNRAWAGLKSHFRRVAALAAEVNSEPSAVGVEFADEPGMGTFHIAALSPIGSFDRQRVLGTNKVADRVVLLEELLAEAEELLLGMAAMGGGELPD